MSTARPTRPLHGNVADSFKTSNTLAPTPPFHLHPLTRRHYRVATAAIEALVDLVNHCLRVRIPGALVYARPRMGKTHAIDYAALHLAMGSPRFQCNK